MKAEHEYEYPAGTMIGDLERAREARQDFGLAVAHALLAIPLLGRVLRWLIT